MSHQEPRMFKKHSRRSGFTLPEVLVTVAIVAVLAAMVVPAVTQQINKGDEPALRTSLGSLRTAITSFVSDVRAFPGQVDHLQADVTTADFALFEDGDGTGAPTYTSSQETRWRGPYDNSGSTNGLITLGMDWQTTNLLMDSLGYLVVEITKTAGANQTDADELDDLIDDGNPATGMVRYEVGTPPALEPLNKVRLFLMSSAR
jgi:prepilin-type N-terminal cleavage/methylation domain-containing protein